MRMLGLQTNLLYFILIYPDLAVLQRLSVTRMQVGTPPRSRLPSSRQDSGGYQVFHLDSYSPYNPSVDSSSSSILLVDPTHLVIKGTIRDFQMSNKLSHHQPFPCLPILLLLLFLSRIARKLIVKTHRPDFRYSTSVSVIVTSAGSWSLRVVSRHSKDTQKYESYRTTYHNANQ